MRKLDQQIAGHNTTLEPFKDLPEFSALANQLNNDLEFKDQEIKNRKKKKYQRDINVYNTNSVFKWQSKLREEDLLAASSTPEKEVRIVTNDTNGTNTQDTTRPVPQSNQQQSNYQTPRGPWGQREDQGHHRGGGHRGGNQGKGGRPYYPYRGPNNYTNYNQVYQQYSNQRNDRRSLGPSHQGYGKQHDHGHRTRTPPPMYHRSEPHNYYQQGRSPMLTQNRYEPLRDDWDTNRTTRHFLEERNQERASKRMDRREVKKKPTSKRGCRAGYKKQAKKRVLGGGIFNLSEVSLTKEEMVVLDRGLKYAPVRNMTKFDIYVDIQKYVQKLNIKKYVITTTGEKGCK